MDRTRTVQSSLCISSFVLGNLAQKGIIIQQAHKVVGVGRGGILCKPDVAYEPSVTSPFCLCCLRHDKKFPQLFYSVIHRQTTLVDTQFKIYIDRGSPLKIFLHRFQCSKYAVFVHLMFTVQVYVFLYILYLGKMRVFPRWQSHCCCGFSHN